MEKSGKSNVITLRGYSKFRILNEMIESVKKNATFSRDYIVMILDDVTTTIFQQTCKMYDLFLFKIYHVEKLSKKRKRYDKTDAVYFISPSRESIQHLIDDFTDPDRIQYGAVHLCFAGRISDAQIELIQKCKNLTSRLKTCKEINMHFYMFEDNIFTLNRPESFYLFNTDLNDVRTNSFLESLGYQLFTVCSILLEKPYIQFQGNSVFSESVAKFVKSNCDEFYDRLKAIEKKDKFRTPRARLIILDRSFDLCSPVQHDFAYQSLVYDTKETVSAKTANF
jgi:syntaxin-binding protein 1